MTRNHAWQAGAGSPCEHFVTCAKEPDSSLKQGQPWIFSKAWTLIRFTSSRSFARLKTYIKSTTFKPTSLDYM